MKPIDACAIVFGLVGVAVTVSLGSAQSLTSSQAEASQLSTGEGIAVIESHNESKSDSSRNSKFEAGPDDLGCEFPGLELDQFTRIFAGGAYEGRRVGRQIDDSGHEATQMDVIVNSPKAPVVVIVGSHEPTIWNFGWTPSTKIVAVLVSGYHRQVVAGLPNHIPLQRSFFTRESSSSSDPTGSDVTSTPDSVSCGYFYVAEPRYWQVESVSKRLFSRKIDSYFTAKNGYLVMGAPLSAQAKIQTSTGTTPESFLDFEAPRARATGILDALREGKIRQIRPADIRDLKKRFERLNKKGFEQFQRALESSASYVVVSNFHYPAGLFGSNAAIFILPNGVPMPQGVRGDSSLMKLNDRLSCEGPNCPR